MQVWLATFANKKCKIDFLVNIDFSNYSKCHKLCPSISH